MANLLFIGVGGFFGAISRYLLSKLINNIGSTGLIPWGTIVVNIIGAFILAFLMTANFYRFQMSSHILLFIGTGFLGAFTTFSTFTYETLKMFQGSHFRGFLYVGATLLLGYIAAYIGFILGRGKL